MKPVLILATALAGALPAAAEAGTVTVEITGVRAGGTLYVQLQSRGQFLGQERVAGELIQVSQPGTVRVDLGEVPAGDYAVSVWHDQNDNQRMEIDPGQGQAVDGWAMANGGAIRARPEFDQVKLSVPAAGAQVPLALRYGF